ncbi:PREDICTED: histidine kinase CKI1-like [Prunus mume]|uniref:histidine kinase n=1 Tax=Prunus mume TaxID=102107 RepID=A0ABM0PD27_PRUMU|nr:PREDICTED: histidine kinase CKI1-like [Prunus mume]
MKLQHWTVLRHVFFVLLVIGMLVLSGLLIGIIKHIEHNVLAFAYTESGLVRFVHKNSKVAFTLLIVMIAVMGVFSVSYIFVMLSAGKREMLLCATLIKQMEATQQAERKSMRKSLAFVSASHDVRAALTGITGLIEISYDEVARGSELETNLRQMETCTKDLLGILNSILDTSKIEAGKMQLVEEEFDVAQLLEDVVDLYHPMGLKKGIDVVLDPYDGSITKFARVKGDGGRLKQILCNLLSNAVKFTSEGHVTVRAWVEKPDFKNSIAANSDRSGAVLKNLLCFLSNKKKSQDDDMEVMNGVQQDPNCLEFIFEVDDTGKGIPKEKQKAVFENYVQVKETGLGEGGTGLGLGIVQSLVRLMHGEIRIVDKEIGERGTCFRFNVLLSNICENLYKDRRKEEDLELGIAVIHSTPSTPGLTARAPSPKAEGSNVVLLIKNEECRRMVYKFMESIGIKAWMLEQWEQLRPTLKKIKHKGKGYYSHHHSSSGISDLGLQDCLSKSTSCNSSFRLKEVHPLMGAMDGTENIISLFKKNSTNLRGTSSCFTLLVIDTTAGPFEELCNIVAEFQKSLQNAWCKVVWLANPLIQSNINFDSLDPDDVIKHKALHGTRLYEVVRLLPEYGGALPKRLGGTFDVGKVSRAPSSSRYQFHTDREFETLSSPTQNHKSHNVSSKARDLPVDHGRPLPHRETEGPDKPSRPLVGKKFLVAEDQKTLAHIAMKTLTNWGATVKLCGDGGEALDLVRNDLVTHRKHGYDYILMDCQMPIMDGFEAAREIRKEEKSYDVHIPIIALTSHEQGEETRRMIEAGMDHHLTKPLKLDSLLETIRYIDSNATI